MEPEQKHINTKKRPSVLLIVLATIGGISLITVFFFMFIIINLISRAGSEAVRPATGDGVGIIKINGVISSADEILKNLRQLNENKDVKAFVIRIDSPGGAVGASQEIYKALRQLDSNKPVVASLENTAASGAFYAACGARYIVSNPGTVTGSIGVIMKLPNVSGLLEKLGIKTTVIKSGRLKDLASITRDLTEEERLVLKEVMDDIHEQFIRDVATGRGLKFEDVKKIADGRIFSGRQALKLKLVDELGNFYTAVKKAAALGKIKGKPRLIYPEKDKLTVIKQILEDSGANMALKFFKQLSSQDREHYLSAY